MLARTLSSWGRLLGLGAKPDSDEDRRAHGRITCDLETTCYATGREHSQPVTVRIKNVSRSGACLLVPRAFRTGELVSVHLPTRDQQANTDVLACVVRCDPLSEDRWEVGCNFSTTLTEEDLDRFSTRDSTSAPPEQRSWVRFVCQTQARYQLASTAQPETWLAAEVVNVSGGGIAMQVEESLEVGDLLSVELRRDNVPSLTALASIVRTSVDPNGRRLVGCNFIHELPEDQISKLLS